MSGEFDMERVRIEMMRRYGEFFKWILETSEGELAQSEPYYALASGLSRGKVKEYFLMVRDIGYVEINHDGHWKVVDRKGFWKFLRTYYPKIVGKIRA